MIKNNEEEYTCYDCWYLDDDTGSCCRGSFDMEICHEFRLDTRKEGIMCDYCDNNLNKPIKLKKNEHSLKEPDFTMISNLNEDTPGLVFFYKSSYCGWVDIDYCPMCGRKLEKE